jgi:hypothetical protein
LSFSLGLWLWFICNLNLLFLCETTYFLFRLHQLINRRCRDEFHPFDPLCLFSIQDVKIHKGPLVLAEITSLRQCIGGTIVYFLNRQGGSNVQDEFSINNLALSIQKVNYMR